MDLFALNTNKANILINELRALHGAVANIKLIVSLIYVCEPHSVINLMLFSTQSSVSQ